MSLTCSLRDPADNAPARTNWSTPCYCANLQAPRDTWVQLCTASLVEPTHHVSACHPAAYSHLSEVFNHPNFPSSTCFLLTLPSSLFHSPVCASVSPRLEQTAPPCTCFCCVPQRSEAAVSQSPNVYFCSHFPPDLESIVVCNCSNLTWAPTGNHGTSAPVCKNKTKVQQPLYYYCYDYATFSNVFTKAALLFFLFICQPVIRYLCGYFILSFSFCCVCHWNSRRTLDQSWVSVTPVSMLCWCVCGPACCCSVGWKILGTYFSLSSPSVTTKDIY